MTTLDAVAGTAGEVTLTITPTGTVLDLVRDDANGTGIPVRHAGELPIVGAGPAVVLVDHEAAHGTVTYRALDVGGVLLATDTVTLTLDGPRITAPLFPDAEVTPTLVTGYAGRRRSATTVHDRLGNPTPMPVLGPLLSRSGELTVYCPSYAEVVELVELLRVWPVFMLRQPDYAGLDLYGVVDGDVEEAPDQLPGHWRVTVAYREVGRPAGELSAGPPWSWADVQATYSTWAELEAAHATWGDLAGGPA